MLTLVKLAFLVAYIEAMETLTRVSFRVHTFAKTRYYKAVRAYEQTPPNRAPCLLAPAHATIDTPAYLAWRASKNGRWAMLKQNWIEWFEGVGK